MWTPDPSIIITAEEKAGQQRAIASEQLRAAICEHIDQTARQQGYEGGAALASYIASINPAWAAQARAFIAWRDAVWLSAHAELSRIANGAGEFAAKESVIGALPPIDWSAKPVMPSVSEQSG